MSNWIYKEEINFEKYYGFVYKIVNLETGKFYIGKKSFRSEEHTSELQSH